MSVHQPSPHSLPSPPDSHARDTWLIYSDKTHGITRLSLPTAQGQHIVYSWGKVSKQWLLALELFVISRLIRSGQT